jgi:hypothetical protein
VKVTGVLSPALDTVTTALSRRSWIERESASAAPANWAAERVRAIWKNKKPRIVLSFMQGAAHHVRSRSLPYAGIARIRFMGMISTGPKAGTPAVM